MEKSDKTFYDKKILYLDYREQGKKIRNGGFAKWEAGPEECRLFLQIRNLPPTDGAEVEISVLAGGRAVSADRFRLQYGRGEYISVWRNENLAGTGVSLPSCEGVLLTLPGDRELIGRFREKDSFRIPGLEPTEPVPEAEAVPETEEEAVPETEEEAVPEEEAASEAQPAPKAEEEAVPETEEEPAPETEEEAVPETEEEAVPEQEPASEAQPLPAQAAKMQEVSQDHPQPYGQPISGDKWEQLKQQYPSIRPFYDEREYLSVTPRDFVVLTKQYQRLVQNSFLLHGYYNYGHVILTCIREKGEDVYYIGVPGVYYEKEKQAALLFGFEGFESETEEIKDGGFGYYMKRVEI